MFTLLQKIKHNFILPHNTIGDALNAVLDRTPMFRLTSKVISFCNRTFFDNNKKLKRRRGMILEHLKSHFFKNNDIFFLQTVKKLISTVKF